MTTQTTRQTLHAQLDAISYWKALLPRAAGLTPWEEYDVMYGSTPSKRRTRYMHSLDLARADCEKALAELDEAEATAPKAKRATKKVTKEAVVPTPPPTPVTPESPVPKPEPVPEPEPEEALTP